MTTVRIWKGDIADARMKVRYGRKHGMPRGRGRKAYRFINRIYWNDAALRGEEGSSDG